MVKLSSPVALSALMEKTTLFTSLEDIGLVNHLLIVLEIFGLISSKHLEGSLGWHDVNSSLKPHLCDLVVIFG